MLDEVVKMCSCILIVVMFNLMSYDQTGSLLIFHQVSVVMKTDCPRALLNELGLLVKLGLRVVKEQAFKSGLYI